MYSFGSTPFAEVEPEKLLSHLETGKRLDRPELCPTEMYSIMEQCWLDEPEERPTFQEMLTLFTVLLEKATEGYGYLSLLKTTNEHYEKLNRLALAKSFSHEIARLVVGWAGGAIDAMGTRLHTPVHVKVTQCIVSG